MGDDLSGIRQLTGGMWAASAVDIHRLQVAANRPVATAAIRNPTVPAVLDAALVGQLFDAEAKAGEPSPFGGHSVRAHDAANNVLATSLESTNGLDGLG